MQRFEGIFKSEYTRSATHNTNQYKEDILRNGSVFIHWKSMELSAVCYFLFLCFTEEIKSRKTTLMFVRPEHEEKLQDGSFLIVVLAEKTGNALPRKRVGLKVRRPPE